MHTMWNRPAEVRPKEPPRKPLKVKGLVAGALVVVIGAAVAWWVLAPSSDRPVREGAERDRRIKEVKPSAPPKPKELTKEEKERLAHPGMELSPVGVWQPTNRPYRTDAKKVHGVYTNYSNKIRKEDVPYRNATEQLLFQTFSCRLGQSPMPFIKLPRKDMDNLVAILIDKNEVSEKDSPQMAANKELIAAAKKELKAYIKEGGKPNDFFEHYHHQLELAAQKRRDAMMQLNKIIREDRDPELARQFQAKVNEQFEKEGIMKLSKRIYDDPDDN